LAVASHFFASARRHPSHDPNRVRVSNLIITDELAVNVARLFADGDLRKGKPESNDSRIVQDLVNGARAHEEQVSIDSSQGILPTSSLRNGADRQEQKRREKES